ALGWRLGCAIVASPFRAGPERRFAYEQGSEAPASSCYLDGDLRWGGLHHAPGSGALAPVARSYGHALGRSRRPRLGGAQVDLPLDLFGDLPSRPLDSIAETTERGGASH